MKEIFKDVYISWKDTFLKNKFLFFVELISTILGMLACTLININPIDPNMFVVLGAYAFGAVGLAWASYKRRASFMLLLMTYYSIWSFIGFFQVI